MKYTLQTIDSISVLILDPSGETVGKAMHLSRGVWNLFTADLEHLGTCQGKGLIVSTFKKLTEATKTPS